MITTNNNPTGTATAALPNGSAGTDYVISAATLLQGFSDPDGDTLAIANLVFHQGSVTDNGNGTYTFIPSVGFTGNASMAFDVVDGKGGSALGSQTFFFASPDLTDVNDSPIGTATAALPGGTENTDYVISAATLLQGFYDPDGDTLAIANLVFHQGSVTDNADGTYTLTPTAGFNGIASMAFDVVDGRGGLTLGSQTFRINDVADAGNNNLFGTGGDDYINGLAGNDAITGLDGNDTLDGGADADTMMGGYGNDTYLVDNANDVIIEINSPGSDTVQSSVSFSIGNIHIEDLQLSGSAANGSGNWLNNTITGNAGNNELNGQGGADALIGGDGNDLYIVNDVNDAIIELANQGVDCVNSNVSFTLANDVERLFVRGTAAIDATGNGLTNILRGNSASNTITGGAGTDVLFGLGGADVFVMDDAGGSADIVKDFVSTVDHLVIDLSPLGTFGNGNNTVDNAVTGNNFSSANELVIISTQVTGALSRVNAAAAIGNSTDALAAGSHKVFVLDNGTDTAVYLFTGSADGNNQVAYNELQLIAIMKDFNNSAIADYQFQA